MVKKSQVLGRSRSRLGELENENLKSWAKCTTLNLFFYQDHTCNLVMGSYRLVLALLCLIGLAFFHVSQAQNSPEDYLKAHNDARAEVGVGSMTWDDTVAAYARIYANERARDCKLVHSGGTYGENIAWSSGNMSATEAVQLWASEKPYYDYNSNSCIGGQQCQHYTQLVWHNSVGLGCARVQCNAGGTFITCNYNPPGNCVGQRPFLIREASACFHVKLYM
ncbi:pathogenesis-related leaf protein 6-like [Macadamia integrifolia]|uniref:pathogenesis-related leaf protein 6-like n=1 Tax=Macadamia integrifolia TaxID=60698 RepID=UPI001C4F7262|nr:pathogenesis-related leaf protein 6-like [Macadamia integrifolia]